VERYGRDDVSGFDLRDERDKTKSNKSCGSCRTRKGEAMNPKIESDRDWLAGFCRRRRIQELSLFGSALREDFSPESDLDFLVSFEPESEFDLFDLLDMKDELEARYGHAVDFIEKEALRNPWRKREILKNREVIYGA